VFAFLSAQGASCRNLLFEGENLFNMLKAFDRKWKKLLPYTVLIDTHGEITYRKEGKIDIRELAEVIGGADPRSRIE
jgi:hypothetical protein